MDRFDKAALRREYIEKRGRLGAEEVAAASRAIWDKLRALPEFAFAEKIFFFVSFDNEVNTHGMIKESLRMGKRVFVPKVLSREKGMIPVEILNFERDLAPGVYGILEPRLTNGYEKGAYTRKAHAENGQALNTKDGIRQEEIHFDMIIVPGVIFDLKGNRIGHGAGYYDRFLSGASAASSLKIGIAHDWQLVDSLSPEAYDVPVDAVITDKREVWTVGKRA